MTQKKTVEVTIGQQRLSLKTDQEPERVLKVAEIVNERLNVILPFGQPVSHQVLMLLAMTLAEDLLSNQEEGSRFKNSMKERSQSILTQLEREFSL